MRIAYASTYGIIVELDASAGYRLVSGRGLVGPVLSSPESIAQHMPYTDWVEANGAIDLDAWLLEHGIGRDTLLSTGEPQTSRG